MLPFLLFACTAARPADTGRPSDPPGAADTDEPGDPALGCDHGAAATVGGVGYATVAEAAETASDSTVHLCAGTWPANLAVEGTLTLVGAGVDVTVLDGGGVGRVVEVVGGTLVLTDATVSNGLAVEGERSAWGGGVAGFDADLTFERVTFRENSAEEGGGAALVDGRFVGREVRFEANVGTIGGGGLTVAGYVGAEAACHACTFAANAARGLGGGLDVYGTYATVTLDEGTVVRDHVVEGLGGGIFVGSGALVLDGVTIADNRVTEAADYYGGGGLYVMAGTVTASDTTVSGNEAWRGGGVYLDGMTAVCPSIAGLTITGNTAEEGGGVYLHACGSVDGVTMEGNTAAIGGGLYAYPYLLDATVRGGAITGNTATTGGGAFLDNDLTHLDEVGFGGNTPEDAATGAGATYVWDAVTTVTCEGDAGCR